MKKILFALATLALLSGIVWSAKISQPVLTQVGEENQIDFLLSDSSGETGVFSASFDSTLEFVDSSFGKLTCEPNADKTACQASVSIDFQKQSWIKLRAKTPQGREQIILRLKFPSSAGQELPISIVRSRDSDSISFSLLNYLGITVIIFSAMLWLACLKAGKSEEYQNLGKLLYENKSILSGIASILFGVGASLVFLRDLPTSVLTIAVAGAIGVFAFKHFASKAGESKESLSEKKNKLLEQKKGLSVRYLRREIDDATLKALSNELDLELIKLDSELKK
ncbi:hypothetical protein HY993_03665 [Candidatus Micrarchaeota archaeon]|nr:hypothetical protein [Candidatus Micrarchaeota archaeon]